MIASELTGLLAFACTLVLFSGLKAMQNTLNTLAERHLQQKSDDGLSAVRLEIAKSL